ncbi:HAD family hydrolase [Bacillus sp. FJAT-27245]|uniref:HAD family hydrolase n=1 Tax=Bacillus sp. FJAT-27245 TaxID=1684144 RepID=UPI0006A7E115|nr:HAD-IA family hydrolase [Bacillus sp. FJAT-27245]
MQSYENVKVIFFDAGGILFDTFIKGDDRIRRLLEARGYRRADIDLAIERAKEIPMPFVTTWLEEESYFKHYYGTIARELGASELMEELFFCAHYANHCELFPEADEVLEDLYSRYRLAVISNATPSMDWVFDRLGIRKYFHTIILSAHVKTEKPDEAIYKLALERLQAESRDCIFIDDKLENVESASRVGMRAFHLDREKQDLKDLLEEIGILRASIPIRG